MELNAEQLEYLTADAADRRAALAEAVELVGDALEAHKMTQPTLRIADEFYAWLRDRESLKASKLVLTAGPVEQQPGT